jgi:hypothetical protein
MRRTRRVWCKAAGLLLAATAAGPVLAQGGSGTKPLTDDTTPRVLPSGRKADLEVLPVPKAVDEPTPRAQPAPAPAPAVLPATQGCGPGCGANGATYPSQRWLNEKHAACQAHFWGYPAEFEAPPLGAAVHAHFRTMVANGEAAAMVLYHCDFVCGTSTLNLHGRDQLTRIACMAAGNAAPIIIERSPDAPGLAEARRAAVLNILALNNVPVPPERVLVGPPIAHGLSGVDAMQLYFYSLRNLATQAQPLPVPASGSGVGFQGGGGTGGGLGGGTGGGFGGSR